ncbi:GGDEF domain-containing protein [Myxococcaceae bacterium GXIMD 01537]
MSERAPHIDPTTGAFLRPHFEGLLAMAITDANASRLPLSVLWADVDETQEANDAHGREAVDEALAALASELSTVLDGRGPVGRVEGDAFATLLFAVTPDAAVRLANTLRERYAARGFPSASGPFHLTVSVGVVALRPGEPYGNLLDAAESACLQAKQGGRDRTVAR